MPNPESSPEAVKSSTNNSSLEFDASTKSLDDSISSPPANFGEGSSNFDSPSKSTFSLDKGDSLEPDNSSDLFFGNSEDLYGLTKQGGNETKEGISNENRSKDPFNLHEFELVGSGSNTPDIQKKKGSTEKETEADKIKSPKGGEEKFLTIPELENNKDSDNSGENKNGESSEKAAAKELSQEDIKKRIDNLDDDDFETRERAREELVEAGGQKDVRKSLKEAAENPISPEQQKQAQRALQKIEEEGQGQDLDDSDLSDSESSKEGKRDLSKEDIENLTRDLDSDDFQTREEATRALSRAGNGEEVMKHMAKTIENPVSLEQKVRAKSVVKGLGENATPEQLKSMHEKMQEDGELTEQQKDLYKEAINAGLRKANGPVEFKDSKGRVTGIYDGSLDNVVMEAKYNDQDQLEEGTIRDTKFTRNEDGTYNRSDGFTVENARVTPQGDIRFNFEGRGDIEWRQNGDSAFYDRQGRWTSTSTMDGRTITPRGERHGIRP